MDYSYKLTSHLQHQDILDILQVRRVGVQIDEDEGYFQWKYLDNPFGDSLHAIVRDDNLPVASFSFWRNDLFNSPAYQCVDFTVIPNYQRKGLFAKILPECIKRLSDSYLYTYPNDRSGAGFLKFGWTIHRQAKVSILFRHNIENYYSNKDPIPTDYVKWRFVNHPKIQYYACRIYKRFYLLSKRRKACYAIAGPIAENFSLPQVNPLILFSYDIQNRYFNVPKMGGYFYYNTNNIDYCDFIPFYKVDTL